MSLTIGELTGFARIDDTAWRRGLSDAELRMRGFTRDTDGRLRNLRGRFATESDLMAAGLRRTSDEGRRAGVSLGRLGSMAGSLGAAAASAGMMAMRVGAIVPVAAAAAATLANIAPAAGVAASAVFALAQATAAFKIGTSGIGGALSAAFSSAGKAAGGAASGASAAAAAQQALKDAVKNAARANEDAAERVADAERSLADAQKTAKAAQLALNDARKQGARDLEDLNNELKDAELDQREAVMDVAEAEKELAQARAEGSPEEIERAQLAYERAVQRLEEARTSTKRLAEDTKKANAAGVEGSEAVLDAQQRIADTQRDVADRERDLADAREDAARTAADGIEQVRRAQQALADAMSGGGGGGGGVDPFAEAMAKLAPAAREFVRAVIALKPAWDALRLDVQQTLFEGLAGDLTRTARSVLPVLRTGLVDSADALNAMAKGAMASARELATSGTLGRAMASASAGLHNLAGAPGFVVTALTQIAAAAGPSFERLTEAAGNAMSELGDELTAAFEDGRMQAAIEQAIDLIGEIAEVAGNVGSILASVFKAADQSGGGFIGVLQEITGQLADAFASPEIQAGLKALFSTMSVLAKTAGPLLAEALKIVAGVLVELGPPAQMLIEALGAALLPILEALGPVLGMLARALGAAVVALLPMLPPISLLVSSLLPALTPILEALIPAFEAWSEVLVALTPLLVPIIILAAQLAAMLSEELAAVITDVVVPAFEMIAALLRGDFSVALEHGKTMVRGMIDYVRRQYTELPGKVWSALMSFSTKLGGRMDEGGRRMRERAAKGVADAVAEISRLPGKAWRALGDLGDYLWRSGRALVRGFIDGILSMADDVANAASSVLSGARDLFPFSPAKKGPFSGRGWTLYSGRSISEALAAGIASGESAVAGAAQSMLTAAHPGMALPGAPAGGGSASRTVLEIRSDGRPRSDWLVAEIRESVTVLGRGSVQLAFGEN